MTVVCVFGDSIAWGAADSESGGWVARLNSYLQISGYDAIVYNRGVCGDDTDRLLRRFKMEATALEPDVIIFAIGINDSQHVRPRKDSRIRIEKFRKNLEVLLNQAKRITGRIIYVGLTRVDESKTVPIPCDAVDYYNNESISGYDAAIKKLCQKNKVAYIGMLDLLSAYDLEDGLHPNSRGHEKMFERVRKSLFDTKMLP